MVIIMKHTLGILAHVDAGKTTLSEKILFHTNTIRTAGRVDDGSTHMDYSDIERERGITVFSDAARIVIDNNVINLIDTPGHSDFSAETERAVSVMDYAVLVVSAVEGVQSHTEYLWNLLKLYKVPTFIFINKTDIATADVKGAFNDIKNKLSDNVIDFSVDCSEELAEKSEILLEEFLEKGSVKIGKQVKKLISDCEIYPCFNGSALKDICVEQFLNSILELMMENERKAKVSASCYKVKRNNHVRLAYLKINSGKITVKDKINTPYGERKIDEIYFLNGSKYISTQTAEEGDICAVSGLAEVNAGDVIGEYVNKITFESVPVFTSRVIYAQSFSSVEIYDKLKILEDEENTLSVFFAKNTDEINICVMGKMSLQIIQYEFMRRFGIKIEFGSPNVLYRETVAEPVIGYGHFEPLRHYAEVHIKINPLPKGSGIKFKSECNTDLLRQDVQNLIKTHIFEKKHKGVLTGGEITDVEYVLVNGRTHLKHTEGGDLREATYRAIRQGLMNARNVLLEPFFSFTIRCEVGLSGRIMTDIQKMGGSFIPPENDGNFSVIQGKAPARIIYDYVDDLINISGGRATVNLIFDGYEPCVDAEKIVAESLYNPEADVDNTPDSVFCAKGAGFNVKWHDVGNYIHCK